MGLSRRKWTPLEMDPRSKYFEKYVVVFGPPVKYWARARARDRERASDRDRLRLGLGVGLGLGLQRCFWTGGFEYYGGPNTT